jgi:hypothetical protein
MTVNLEVKGNVARLLATENLIVENKRVDSASFNVDTRVLTLPLWQKSSNVVYDLLVAHEVSHALYTPNEDWDPTIPHQFLNVVEDVRVEKLIKRKFSGLSKTFYRGYKEFCEKDYFEIGDHDINEMNLADRINIYFKIGSFLNISFTEKEKEILDIVGAVNTFEDTQSAALILYKFCKEENEQQQINIKLPQSDSEDTQSPSHSDENSYPIDSQPPEVEEENEEEDLEEEGSSTQNDDLEVKTDTASTSKIRNLVDCSAYPSTYLEFPTIDLSKVINTNKEIHDYIKDFWAPYTMNPQNDVFHNTDTKYINFKKSAQKEVNYLVKEFEMKKAASSYARASVSRTGVLDCTKLHTYKYNEDLFRKVTTFPDGKNHGLVFILDWSGSMGEIMQDTIKQLYSLIWFCKKVGIPFSVYAFTYQFNDNIEYNDYGFLNDDGPYIKKSGTLHVGNEFSLMEFFTSDTSQKVLDEQMRNIFRVVVGQRSYSSCIGPPRLGLSGTPLNEALITLRQLIPSLQSKWDVEKTQCVILTDGESNHLGADRWIDKDQEHLSSRQENDPNYLGRWSRRRLRPNSDYLRNRKTGVTYSVSERWWEFTTSLVDCLKDELPSVNFIGIRLLSGRDATEFIRRYYGCGYETGKLLADWRKNKSIVMKMVGYDAYFGICSDALSSDTSFDVDEGASKAKIKSAFIKSLKTKKLNKKVLGEFISLVV